MARACPTPQPLRNVLGTVVFITVVFLLAFLARLIFSPLMPAIQEDPAMGVASGQAGALFLLGAIGMLAGSFLAPLFYSSLNHRHTLILSLFVMAATLVGAYFADSLWGLRAVFFVLGACFGLHQPSSMATLTATVRREDWSRALSIQQLAPPLALVTGPLITVALLTWFSWDEVLLWIAGIIALVAVVFYFATPGIGSFQGEPPSPSAIKPVVSTRSFWVMIFLFALGMGAQVGVYTMLPLYLHQERDMTVASANTLLGLANLAPLVTVFVSGWVTSRLGEKRTMAIALVLTGVAAIFVGLLSGVGMKICVVLMAAMAVCYFPPAFAALSRIVQPNYRSLAAAFCPPTGFVLGGGLLPLALGYMGQSWSFSTGIIIIGAVITVGAAAVSLLHLLTNLEEGC
ncbi:MAG: MFS transporter [Actinomycetia bacterium]|nr:MFS transporter [Actinomycetes bacterium]